MEDCIPSCLEDVNRGWLLMVINNFRKVQNKSLIRSEDEIKSVNCQSVSTNGFTKTMLAEVTYNCFTSMGTEQFTENFFIKLASDVDKTAILALESRLLEREVSLCLKIVPRMKMFLEVRKPSIILPTLVFGAYKASGKGVSVAMKNELLKGSISEEVSMKNVTQITRGIAKYHAASMSYIFATGKDNFVREFPHQDGSIFNNDEMFARVNSELKEFSLLLRRVPGLFGQHRMFEEWRSNAWDVISSTEDLNGSSLCCLTHGLLSLEDIMFKDDNLQLTSISNSHISSPVIDVLTLLMTSTDIEDWKSNREILEQYHTSLMQELKILNKSQNSSLFNIKLDQVIQEFQAFRYKAFILSILILTKKMKLIEEEFSDALEDKERLGKELRFLSSRAIQLVDSAMVEDWRKNSPTQMESSTLTIKLNR